MKTFNKEEMRAYVEEKMKTEPIIWAKKTTLTPLVQGKLIKRIQIKDGETYYTDMEGNRIPNEIAEKNFYDSKGKPLQGKETVETYTDEDGKERTRTITVIGERIISWIVGPDGAPTIEREGSIEIDPETGGLGWIATTADNDGNPVIDKNGKINQYIIVDSKRKELYEDDPVEIETADGMKKTNLYKKRDPEKFIRADEDLQYETKYGTIKIIAGGYIKITNLDRISGVNEREFDLTYEVIEEPQNGLKR